MYMKRTRTMSLQLKAPHILMLQAAGNSRDLHNNENNEIEGNGGWWLALEIMSAGFPELLSVVLMVRFIFALRK